MKNHRNTETLADRMKKYEAVTTTTSLIPKLPVYARIDGRAFHTFCRTLNKPFDKDMVKAMQETTRHLVDSTGAIIGYVQSDEISLCWKDTRSVPFETRLFKLQSILAGIASAYFNAYSLSSNEISQSFKDRCLKYIPHFDCRVCQMPTLDEVANMILWREQDSIKNSISLLALEHFSNKELYKKNSNDKIKMLLNKGIDYFTLAEELRVGSYFRREVYTKTMNVSDNANFVNAHVTPDENGNFTIVRSKVDQVKFSATLQSMQNKTAVLFNREQPILRK